MFTIISSALVYAETATVDVGGNSFDFEYSPNGMTVSGVVADEDFISLIFTVDVVDSTGRLDVTFDRSFFDSTFEGLDDEFIILADGDEPNFTEIDTNAQSRTLSIELAAGTEEVEIIGSVFGDSSTPVEDTADEDTADEDTADEDTAAEEAKAAADAAAAKAAADAAAAKAAADAAAAKAAEEAQKTQCGPGTVLKDGACVLDERCGPGTVLKNGECVVESTPQPVDTSVKGIGKELVIAVIGAIGIAGAIGIILGLMAKANKNKD